MGIHPDRRHETNQGIASLDVAMVGLGPMGCLVASSLLARPSYHLVAAADSDDRKVGQDVGTIIGKPPTGVLVVDSCRNLPSPKGLGVGILCTASRLGAVSADVKAMLGLGWAVLSTCEELSEPWSQPELAAEIDEFARQARRPVLGTGVNPGYLMDTLPLLLTAACDRVDHVAVHRRVDTNERRLPLQHKVGVGLSLADFEGLASQGRIGHVGLRQSAELLAEGLGWSIDSWREEVRPIVAEVATKTSDSVVAAGDVIGLRHLAAASSDGREVISYDLEMFAGAASTDEVDIDGDPPIHSVLKGGLNGDIATAAVVANLVATVANAPPGLLTMRDLMPLAGPGTKIPDR